METISPVLYSRFIRFSTTMSPSISVGLMESPPTTENPIQNLKIQKTAATAANRKIPSCSQPSFEALYFSRTLLFSLFSDSLFRKHSFIPNQNRFFLFYYTFWRRLIQSACCLSAASPDLSTHICTGVRKSKDPIIKEETGLSRSLCKPGCLLPEDMLF